MQNLVPKYSGLRELLNIELMTNYNNSIVEDSIKNKAHINTIVDYGAGMVHYLKYFWKNIINPLYALRLII